MSLTRLLLVAASSKKYIEGASSSKILVAPKNSGQRMLSGEFKDPYAGEVILCFDIDRKEDRDFVSQSLGILAEEKRCDGIIFYSQDGTGERTICLVEMKHSKIDDAVAQIGATRDVIKRLLEKDCGEHCASEFGKIKWKACFYSSGASPKDTDAIKKRLKDLGGFTGIHNFKSNDNDAGPFLRGEVNAEERGNKYRKGKR